jgi:hypothetical protein
MKLLRLIGALALSALAVNTAFAQSAAGGLRIHVLDNSDKSAVIGAAVTLSNTSKLVPTSTLITDVNGVALFPVLRGGSGYVITIIMDGYAGIRQEATVKAGTTQDVVIAMAPEMQDRVLVYGDKGNAVDLDQNSTSTQFSSDFIADLPVAGRFYQNVLALAPGVQDPDGDGNPNVNGARERDFKTSVGGISNVDPLTGTFLNLVTSDSIEDLTVITAGAGAEFGRAQGGFAQIIQKQGSNDFEGVFGMLYASSALDGNGASSVPNNLVPDFYLYQPSLQVSGPIVKDKLWYRLSQEVIRREDPLIFAAGGSFNTIGTKRFSTDNQLTWQVSNRNKLAFNFRADPAENTNQGLSAVSAADTTETTTTGGPTYQLSWTAPYSPTLLIDSAVAYQDTTFSFTPTSRGVDNACVSGGYLAPYQCFDASQGVTTGSSNRDWHDSRQRLTVKSDATYYKGRMWNANHQFKTGIVIENERYFRSLEFRPVFFRQDTIAPGGSRATEFTITASLQPDSQQRAVGNTWGIYGEDVIRPISNLSISVGLRVEQEYLSGPGFVPVDPQADSDRFVATASTLQKNQRIALMQTSFVSFEDRQGALATVNAQFPGVVLVPGTFNGQQANWTRYRQTDDINIQNTNLSPRISVGWDPWNDGKTKFSFSAGRFYDKIFLGVITTEAEPVTATFSAKAGEPRVTFEPAFSYTAVDRNLTTPYNDEFSFAVERTFMQENTISLTYIHRNFKNQLQDTNINQTIGDFGRCAKVQGLGETPLIASPGQGPVVDPYTGLTYQDTDPGLGDGILDDCTGMTERINAEPDDGGSFAPNVAIDVQRPDTVTDFYVLDPAWGNILLIGNSNAAVYDGITLEFVRRQYKNWQMEASYTWSKATGDAEDFNLALGNDRSTLEDEKGYLSFDRRHALKVNATCLTPWGFRLGGTALWQSGLPYSLLFRSPSDSQSLPLYDDFRQSFTSLRTRYLTKQRNDQRNPSAWLFNLKFVKEFNLSKGMNLQLDAEIFNLFNEDTYSVYNDFLKLGRQINGTNEATREFGRQYQLGMRLAF